MSSAGQKCRNPDPRLYICKYMYVEHTSNIKHTLHTHTLHTHTHTYYTHTYSLWGSLSGFGRTGNFGIKKVRIRLPKILKDLWKQRHVVVALLEYVIWDLQTRLQPALMYKHVYSENVHSIAICSITNSRSQRCQHERRHLPKVHILYVNWVNIYNEYAKVYYHWWALLRGRSYFCNKSRRSPVSQHSFGVNTLFAYSHNHESRITITPSQPTENPDQTFVRKFILKGPPSGIHQKKKTEPRKPPTYTPISHQVQGQPTVFMRITQPVKIDRNKGVD